MFQLLMSEVTRQACAPPRVPYIERNLLSSSSWQHRGSGAHRMYHHRAPAAAANKQPRGRKPYIAQIVNASYYVHQCASA